ncbi:VOC family protein [Enemella sp. A6]|uniref:VOC family protein n=1 Tax=Enemella sp. A6 TaxID=3440152 RepID=UPI003EBBFE19
MTAFVSHTTFDCANAYELSQWWSKVLGYADDADDPNKPGDEECAIHDPETGHTLLFIQVPDLDRTVPKRVHLDLRPREKSRDEELRTLLELGATEVADRRGIYGPGSGWIVLADPEGNEFCILRAEHELGQN